MVFEFSVQKTFNEAIDIVDIGNTVLRCENNKQLVYYLITKTIFGKTAILKYGPIYPDLDTLVDDFNVSFKRIDYKEATIGREIDKFINDFKKEISSIEEITEYEAWQEFPNIKQSFENV